MIHIRKPLNRINPKELKDIPDPETSFDIRLIAQRKGRRHPIHRREFHDHGVFGWIVSGEDVAKGKCNGNAKQRK